MIAARTTTHLRRARPDGGRGAGDRGRRGPRAPVRDGQPSPAASSTRSPTCPRPRPRPTADRRRGRHPGRRVRPRALRELGVNGVLGPDLDVGRRRRARRSERRPTRTSPPRCPAFADAVLRAYREAERVRRGRALPGPGLRRPVHRGRSGDRRASTWRSCASATCCPFRAAVEDGVPGRGAEPRALPDERLHGPGVALARRWSPTCCAASSDSRAWRSPTTSPSRRWRSWPPCRRPPWRRSGPARTCSTSRGPPRDQQAAYDAVLRGGAARAHLARAPGRGGGAHPGREGGATGSSV